MSEIDGLIQRLDAWLQENRPEYYTRLNPGVTDEEITSLETFLGWKLPEDFIALYKWKDGSTSLYFEAETLYDAWHFLPIENVKFCWSGLNAAILTDEYFPKNWWKKSWIPYLENNGDFLCLDCEGTFTNLKHQILKFRHDDAFRSVENSSIEFWLMCLVKSSESIIPSDDEPVHIMMSSADRKLLDPNYPKVFFAGDNPNEDPRKWI